MPLTLLKGHFRIIGSSPDGDSVRFYPETRNAFARAGLRVRTNTRGGAQLRLDGIDALETHYRPRIADAGLWRQPAELGDAASDALLDHLGFTDVRRGDDDRITAATPDHTPGHILTRFADKYGRCVAFAFPGQRRGRTADGAAVHLDPDTMTASANYRMVETGLAYPTFYSRLFPDLRQHLADAAATARAGKRGVWAADTTLTGFTVTSRKQLQTELVILPKLFRRLADYLSLDESGRSSLSRFADFVDTRDDRLVTVPEGHATELHTLLETRRQTVRLTVAPERIIFNEA